jgi:hypothetical protein
MKVFFVYAYFFVSVFCRRSFFCVSHIFIRTYFSSVFPNIFLSSIFVEHFFSAFLSIEMTVCQETRRMSKFVDFLSVKYTHVLSMFLSLLNGFYNDAGYDKKSIKFQENCCYFLATQSSITNCRQIKNFVFWQNFVRRTKKINHFLNSVKHLANLAIKLVQLSERYSLES